MGTMEQAVLAQVQQLGDEHARIPAPGESIHKDECGFTFDTPESPHGLYVNLSTMQAYAHDYVVLDHQRTGQRLYLHTRWTRHHPTQQQGVRSTRDTWAEQPQKLALNVDGGFQPDAEHIEAQYALCVMPEMTSLVLPRNDLPAKVQSCIDGVISATDASNEQQAQQLQWEEERKPSNYAYNLPQEPNARKVPPDSSQWVCDESGETSNLWLNLSDGFIGSGRQQPDGSGGNGAALRHFYKRWREEGKFYPLVVKLGTITPYGADVFSYAEDEDDMVEDPYLAEHLAHFGIDIMRMQKTEKSMAELQIDMNMRVEFDVITEAGKDLKPLSGAGYIGMKNLGNTCYLNSVMQVIKELPEFAKRYAESVDTIFTSAPRDVASDYPTQMAKLLHCLLSDRYKNTVSTEDYETQGATTEACVQPRKFKTLICGGHPEFQTSRQQDASDFFQYLLQSVERNERANANRLSSAPASNRPFEFKMQDRLECSDSGKVKYRISNKENVLPLSIPLDQAENKAEVEAFEEREQKRQRTADAATDGEEKEGEPVRPCVPFEACLKEFASPAQIDDLYSPASKRKTKFYKTTRLLNFPKYLAVQARRFYVAHDWTARKLDVDLRVPDEIYLESYLQAEEPSTDEQLLPEEDEEAAQAAAPKVEPDMAIVSQLTAMGFNENGCKKSAIAVNNRSVEEAAEWVFAHMEEEGFSDPPEHEQKANTQSSAGNADPDQIAMLMPMGFTEYQVRAALKECNGNIERAADWLFSRTDNLDEECARAMGDAAEQTQCTDGATAKNEPDDGRGHYELFAMVSHMGANTSCGHYVCHVKKDGQWVLYNDRKVAASKEPPRSRAYMYFFRRKDAQ